MLQEIRFELDGRPVFRGYLQGEREAEAELRRFLEEPEPGTGSGKHQPGGSPS